MWSLSLCRLVCWGLALGMSVSLVACGVPEVASEPDEKHESWSEASHSNDAKPDYERIFATTKVHRLDIVISKSDWQKMQDNMTELLGTFGERSGGGPGGGGKGGQAGGPGGQNGNTGGRPAPPNAEEQQAMAEACKDKADSAACEVTYQGKATTGTCGKPPTGDALVCIPAGLNPGGGQTGGPGGQAGGPGGGGPGGTGQNGSPDLIAEDPVYVPCTLTYEGKVWRHVGIRYKGNSTLKSGWSGGSYKLPFRLSMDKYEDQYASTKNQRFYGFKKLTFGNGFSDDSLLREMIASELYREIGVPVARVAFYRIYIDHGDGAKYFGLYTMVEDPDGPMLETQFKKDGGNLYKPDGNGADWTSFVQAGFPKKTNDDDADWSDVQSAIDALHSSRDDAAAWREKLEKVFNVDGFLRWLALSTLMGHWDTYGNMTHNYYLYADPGDNGRLQWITWDHNMVMMGTNAPRSELPIDLSSIDGNRWPLIRFVYDDPVYKKRYDEYVAKYAKETLVTSKVMARLKTLHELITPYVTGDDGEVPKYTQISSAAAFAGSLDVLQKHIENRQKAASEYASQP